MRPGKRAAKRLIARRAPARRSSTGKAHSTRKAKRATSPLSQSRRPKPRRAPAAAKRSKAATRTQPRRAAPARSAVRAYRLPAHLVVSPDITKHPWEHRRDYLILVAAIAASDSQLHPDELTLLKAWMDRFELPPEARTEVLRVANREKVNLVEIARRLAGTPLTWSVMLDMMGMAMADGVLMDDEILLLRGLAHVLEIDPIDFNILIEFVHSAYQGAQLSNPEPLYEHAIDCAFQLLSKRHVKLFEHTRLCVNFPEYDRQLKRRWAQFETGAHAA